MAESISMIARLYNFITGSKSELDKAPEVAVNPLDLVQDAGIMFKRAEASLSKVENKAKMEAELLLAIESAGEMFKQAELDLEPSMFAPLYALIETVIKFFENLMTKLFGKYHDVSELNEAFPSSEIENVFDMPSVDVSELNEAFPSFAMEHTSNSKKFK